MRLMRQPAVLAVAVVIASLLLTGCVFGGSDDRGADPLVTPSATEITQAESSLPDGWRWESYGAVMVGVPDTWEDGGSTTQLTSQWCIGEGDRAAPVVARPGVSTLVLCHAPVDPRRSHDSTDPGAVIETAGQFVAFSSAPGKPDGRSTEGDRVTVVRSEVSVLVQTTEALRDRIVSTITTADHDHNGCPVQHPVTSDPALRPDPAGDVSSWSGIGTVVACKYEIARDDRDSVGLLSSIEVQKGAEAVAAIARAPVGGGPDDPRDCLADYSYGDDLIVISIDSDTGRHEVYLRYSGCDHNGLDDGTTVRRLTAAAVRPFVAGENVVGSMSGRPAKVHIVRGR